MILIKNRQLGVGLIEVLVATVVIALGLLSLASMQGNFMSSSGDSKARSEALVIAERQMENLRNMMQVGDYTVLPVPTTPVVGSNESFTVAQGVTNLTLPNRKQITITVSWGAGGADEQIVLTSELLFSDPKASVSLSEFGESGSGGSGNAPSPNQNASESVEQTIDLFDANGDLMSGFTLNTGSSSLYTDADGNVYKDDGNSKTGTLVVTCSGLTDYEDDLINELNYSSSTGAYIGGVVSLKMKRVNLDDVAGNESLELYTVNYEGANADGTCTLQHRYFGGVVIPIKGTVHTIFNIGLVHILIDFNKEDMFCVFNPSPYSFTIKESPYACYVGGNCDNGPGGTDSNFNSCPSTAVAKASVGPGGFRGNVGLLNVDDDGGGKESVCFAEEVAGTNTIFSTARKYKTLNSGVEQGVNQSFICQDFFIVGRQANAAGLASECAAEVGTLNLAPKEVIRSLTNVSNTVVTENTSYCTALTPKSYTLTGSVSNVTGTLAVTANGSPCTLSGSDYECTGTTSGTALQVNASTATQSGSCTVSGLTAAPASGSCNIALSVPPTYSIAGLITGLNGGATVTINDSIISESCTSTVSTYSCSITTNETSIRIEGVKNANSNAACTILSLSGLPGESITLPSSDCTLAF